MKSWIRNFFTLTFCLLLSACSLGGGNTIGGILGGQNSTLKNQPDPVVETQSTITPFYDETLALQIQQLESQYEMDPANVCIMVENFSTGSFYKQNEASDYFAASTYKLPLAMLYYEDLARMNVDLNNPDPNQVLGWFDLPTVLEFLHEAIVYSDNDAAMALYENMGGWENYVHRRQIYRNLNDDIILSKTDKTTNTQLKNNPDQQAAAASYEDDKVAITMNADRLAQQFEANYIDGNYLQNVLEYLYANKDGFGMLLEDMKASEPESYLNGRLPGYYYQKYGYYEDAVNIAALSLEASPYLCVVLSQAEAGILNFMADLGVLLKDYYNPNTLPEAMEEPIAEPEPEPIEEAGAQWIPDFPIYQDGGLPEIPQQYVTDENGNAQLYLQQEYSYSYPFGQVETAPSQEGQIESAPAENYIQDYSGQVIEPSVDQALPEQSQAPAPDTALPAEDPNQQSWSDQQTIIP